MRNELTILSFIAIFLIKEGIPVNFLSDKISCIYDTRRSHLVCRLILRNNATEPVTRNIFVNQHSKITSITDFSKYEKGHCSTSDRPNNFCTYFPKKQKFSMIVYLCESFHPFNVIVVENNKTNNFSITPCKHVLMVYNVSFAQNETSMEFLWRLDNHDMPFNSLHNSTYEYSILCLPVDTTHGKTFQRNFRVISNRRKLFKLDVSGWLTSGVKYKCITNARYKKILVCGKKKLCNSKWLKKSKNFIIRTRNDAPSRGPLFYDGMFQVADGLCYVYFLPVPVEYRNGNIRGYQCVCDDGQMFETNRFNFKVECSNVRSSCNLSAINDHGRGSNSTHVNINRKDVLAVTELELWRTSVRNKFKVRWKLSANVNVTKAILLICKCSKCYIKHPYCISMRSKPVLENQIISVDFKSERASIVVESDEQLLRMSEWVECSYGHVSESMDITRIIDKVRENWKTELTEGNRTFIHVTIPTDMLKCGSQYNHFRPINSIYVKRTCPQKKDFVQKYARHVGKETMNFDVEVFQDCDVLLSVDGRKYVSITKNKEEAQLWYLISIVPILIIVIIVCTRKRIRHELRAVHNRCRKWKGRNFGDDLQAQKTMQSMKYISPQTEEGYEVISQVENQNYSNEESCSPRYPTPQVDNTRSKELGTNGNGDNFDLKIYTSQSCEL